MEICRGEITDLEEIVDFGNYVFSHSGGATDFPALLPKIYKKGQEMEQYHYLIKEEDRIKAMLACIPAEMDVMGHTLKVTGIGTVAAHPYSRGKGYMKELMNQAVADMEKDQVDLSILAGKKQRYEHFGYAVSGSHIYLELLLSNIRKELQEESPYHFNLIKREQEEDLRLCYKLHQQKEVRFKRELEKFYDVCISWKAQLWGVYKEKRLVGYIIVDNNQKELLEIGLEDEKELKVIIGYLMKQYRLEKIGITLGLYEVKMIDALRRASERYLLKTTANIRIYNFKKVLQAFLNLKRKYTKLVKGQLVIEIKEYGCYEIQVDDESVQVEMTAKKSDLTMDYFDAMDLLFGPISQCMYVNEATDEKLKNYFPLPFYIGLPDRV